MNANTLPLPLFRDNPEGRRPLVYLAGPDVFFRSSPERFRILSELCAVFGFDALAPEEGELKDADVASPYELADVIYRGNIQRIQSADAVLANLMPFRNPVEPDSGTVFEVGFATALGKPVAGYFPQADQLYQNRVRAAFGEVFEDGKPFDATYGLLIESLHRPLNLMLACSTPLFCEEKLALQHLANVFGIEKGSAKAQSPCESK